MKHFNFIKTIKWLTIALSIFILILLVYSFFSMDHSNANPEQPKEPASFDETTGTLTADAFSLLIEQNIAELGFAQNIAFTCYDEGYFSINGTFSSAARLIAACKDLKPYQRILQTLEGESIIIHGHLGENEQGNGCFAVDTITVSEMTVPAGFATDYIEEYTGLNALLEVPYEQIQLTKEGIVFKEGFPPFIQTALYR